MNKNFFEEFGKPFAAKDVLWRLQSVNEEKKCGRAIPYLDARAIADRLDAVVGQGHWRNTYTQWHDSTYRSKNKSAQKTSQLCTISIYDDELKQWIDKTDGAEDSDTEPIKGGLSDAFKRAAVRWNIGRYLYRFDPVWVSVEPYRDSFVIAKGEDLKLAERYRANVEKIFGKTVAQQLQEQSAKENHHSNEKKKPQADSSQQTKRDCKNASPVYEVKKVDVTTGQKGQNSALILSCAGKNYGVYMHGCDERLKAGVKITNVYAEKQENSFKPYTLLKRYDIAA